MKEKSTQTAILQLFETGQRAIGIFLDLTKAIRLSE